MSQHNSPPTLAQLVESYGPTEIEPLTRLQALTAKAVSRAWSEIPQVTHTDLLDVTLLEARRRQLLAEGARLSLLPFIASAVSTVLMEMPRFNAVLDENVGQLILRRYVHLGFAIDTSKGLLVAVVRDCDRKSPQEIAPELTALSEKARTKGLSVNELSGGGFTISSLGALGGTGFTPIINAPEVAILGISRLSQIPVRGCDGALEWRDMLPVSLTYDHRVINGAEAGRFLAALQSRLIAQANA